MCIWWLSITYEGPYVGSMSCGCTRKVDSGSQVDCGGWEGSDAEKSREHRHIPGEPVAHNYGQFETNNGLLWGILAYYFQLARVSGLRTRLHRHTTTACKCSCSGLALELRHFRKGGSSCACLALHSRQAHETEQATARPGKHLETCSPRNMKPCTPN